MTAASNEAPRCDEPHEADQRFVLLAHDWPRPHHDLLLDRGNACWTWRILNLDRLKATGESAAERLPDHRRHYLDYEGLVGGDRGSVARTDAGLYRLEFDDGDEAVVTLAGETLVGRYRLKTTSIATVEEQSP